MKWIEQDNPYVVGGISRYYVIRETKTQYVCENDIRFRKPHNGECDGCLVRMVGHLRWDHPCKLRIKEKEG